MLKKISYSQALQVNLNITKFLVKFPKELIKYIVDFLKNGYEIYLYHVSFSRKILSFKLSSLDSSPNASVIDIKELKKSDNLIIINDIVNDIINIVIDNIEENIEENDSTKEITKYDMTTKNDKKIKLSKNNYENRNKKIYKKHIVKKRKMTRLSSLKKRYSSNFKFNINNNYPINDDNHYDYDNSHMFNVNLDDWETIWSYCSGEVSYDSHGEYRVGDYYILQYINKKNKNRIHIGGYDKYRHGHYSREEKVRNLGYLDFEYDW